MKPMTRHFLFYLFACLLLGPGPLNAQALTVAELEGMIVTGAVKYAGTFRRPGVPDYDADIVWRFKVQFGAAGAVTSTAVREVHWSGKVATLNRRFVGVMGQPGTNTSKDSQVLWLIDGDTLKALNVFDVGGRTTTFKFTRTASGLACTVDAPHMREVGAGPSKVTAAKGGKAEILKIRQVGSSCSTKKG
jgi:hypothetical protein